MSIKLLGKVLIKSTIEVKTGMRIGGSTGGLKIGGVDLNVITDPLGRPYIPGSSLKGKMRSLIEKKQASNDANFWNKRDRQGNIVGHECTNSNSYTKCPVCKVWGILGGNEISVPTLTRIIVCDTYLDTSSITDEMKENLELEWTEVKFETAINRITGTALHGSLRQAERVPAGARFKDSEIIFNVFEESDKDLLKDVFVAMELLEHDYLGGMGSRGYGRIQFKNVEVYWNTRKDYETGNIDLKPERKINNGWDIPSKLVQNFAFLKSKLI
ncbi:MAG: type III-A CRISPR-associated RAMP protein Csm3 [Deltaproteobacteria bacterium]|nr:type III-A CRISPR-associated RAMP protein Csm3 [Deltaproteobacteria bacterium]